MKRTANSDAMKNRKSSIAPTNAATRYSNMLLILPAGMKESMGFSGEDGFFGSEMIGLFCSVGL
jgi:hypothetical protein